MVNRQMAADVPTVTAPAARVLPGDDVAALIRLSRSRPPPPPAAAEAPLWRDWLARCLLA